METVTIHSLCEATSSTRSALSFLQKCFIVSENEKILNLHFVGSDETECNATLFSPERFATHYGILLAYLIELGVVFVDFLFVGPNMSAQLAGRSFEFSFSSPSSSDRSEPLTVQVTAQACCYHELPAISFMKSQPLFVMMFNAGIWGYSAWVPTLLFLKDLSLQFEEARLKCPVCLVTAYTLLEAEEDFDEIVRVLAPISELAEATELAPRQSLVWRWECELNPQRGSTAISKQTQPHSDSIYLDNQYWSCFHFT